MALSVGFGEVKTAVVAIVAATGEDYPVGVVAPVVVAVGLWAVYFGEFAGFSGLQVEQPLLAFVVPDGEIAVVDEGEKQIAAVVGGAWPGEALALCRGVEKRVHGGSEGALFGVEGNAAEVVALFLEVGRIVLLATGHVVEPPAVGREGRRVLAPVLGAEQ